MYAVIKNIFNSYDIYISFKANIPDLIFELEFPQTATVHASPYATTSRDETFSAGGRFT